MKNQINTNNSLNEKTKINELRKWKDILLWYYYPNWEVNKNNILVLDEWRTKWLDAKTAEEILQYSSELELTEDEKEKLKFIFNWTFVDEAVSLWKDAVSFSKDLVDKIIYH